MKKFLMTVAMIVAPVVAQADEATETLVSGVRVAVMAEMCGWGTTDLGDSMISMVDVLIANSDKYSTMAVETILELSNDIRESDGGVAGFCGRVSEAPSVNEIFEVTH